MLDAGTAVALSRLIPAPGGVPAQPEGSYLVPMFDPAEVRWVSETELSRCEAALQAGTAPDEVAALGPREELPSVAEAARLAGVTPRYQRRLAQRHETSTETTRPVDELLDGWRTRAATLAFGRDALAACLDHALAARTRSRRAVRRARRSGGNLRQSVDLQSGRRPRRPRRPPSPLRRQ